MPLPYGINKPSEFLQYALQPDPSVSVSILSEMTANGEAHRIRAASTEGNVLVSDLVSKFDVLNAIDKAIESQKQAVIAANNTIENLEEMKRSIA